MLKATPSAAGSAVGTQRREERLSLRRALLLSRLLTSSNPLRTTNLRVQDVHLQFSPVPPVLRGTRAPLHHSAYLVFDSKQDC